MFCGMLWIVQTGLTRNAITEFKQVILIIKVELHTCKYKDG